LISSFRDCGCFIFAFFIVFERNENGLVVYAIIFINWFHSGMICLFLLSIAASSDQIEVQGPSSYTITALGERKQYNFSYSNSCSPIVIVLARGAYLVELWGGRGGFDPSKAAPGGLSGYTKGILTVGDALQLFLFIGEGGKAATAASIPPRTCGGGGKGAFLNSLNHGYSGGGAADLRVSEQNASSRIMVAGGGGGASFWNDYIPGGNGGFVGAHGII
jgi:hypothetical protein